MKPSKSFLFTLALVAVAGLTVLLTPAHVRAADSTDPFPLSTKLTPVMIEFFGITPAFQRPSIAALVACHATSACAATDSSRVRVLSASGAVVAHYDGAPTSTIEQVRRQTLTPAAGVTETRIEMRRYSTDAQGRVVMSGTDSILKRDVGRPGRNAMSVLHVRRYSDLRYRVNDPAFTWPMTGLVVLELAHVIGDGDIALTRAASHAAVSFDGTRYAHVLTTGALGHRVDLQARVLETTVPDR